MVVDGRKGHRYRQARFIERRDLLRRHTKTKRPLWGRFVSLVRSLPSASGSHLHIDHGRIGLSLEVPLVTPARVAMLKAEWSLSDAYSEDHEKWLARAERVEAAVFGRVFPAAPLQ